MWSLKLKKSQKGTALVMVMITFMVVAILGVAVIDVSLGEVKQAVALDKDMRAYYLARSAADATITWIEKEAQGLQDDADALASITDDDEFNAALTAYNNRLDEFEKIVPVAEGIANGSTATQITGINNVDSVGVYRQGGYILCEAKATVYGQSSTASVRLEQGGTNNVNMETTESVKIPLFNEAIYANGDLTVSGNANDIYDGNALFEGELKKKTPNMHGGYSCAKNLTDRDYKDWNPPTLPNINPLPSGTLTYLNNGNYGNETLDNKTINIDTGTSPSHNVILQFNQLEYKKNSTIRAIGNGKVFLYINSLNYSGNNAKLSILSSSSNVPNIFLIIKTQFRISGNDNLECYVYAPKADLQFGGSVDICGAIIAQNITFNGNVDIDYNAPSLASGEFNGGDPVVDQTITHSYNVERLNAMGENTRQWLPEK